MRVRRSHPLRATFTAIATLVLAVTGVPTATAAPDTRAPTTPANLRVVDRTLSTIDLDWEPSSDNVGVTVYRIFDGPRFVAYTTDTQYGLWLLPPATTFHFRIFAVDAAGNVSQPSDTAVTATLTDTQVPSTPQDLRVSWQSPTSVRLGWSASVDDDGGSGWIDYLVDDGSATRVVPTSTSTTITNLPTNRTYTFTVRARDRSGNLSGAQQVSAHLENVPPSAPANLRVTGTADGQAVLGWDPATDNSGRIAWYSVLLDGFQTVTTTDRTLRIADLVLDCRVAPGETYTFTVRAHDPSSNFSPPSNSVVVTVN